MLITMKKLLDVAKKEGGFAVPAPNVFSMETTEAAYQAAREMQAPVILNVWDAGAEWIEKQANLALYFEKKYPDVIAALNLDHGQSYDSEVAAIRSGFTSVMSDRSMMSFGQNVEQVKRIVDTAHAVNVSVEAELGHVGQGYEYEQTRDAWLTNPDSIRQISPKRRCYDPYNRKNSQNNADLCAAKSLFLQQQRIESRGCNRRFKQDANPGKCNPDFPVIALIFR